MNRELSSSSFYAHNTIIESICFVCLLLLVLWPLLRMVFLIFYPNADTPADASARVFVRFL